MIYCLWRKKSIRISSSYGDKHFRAMYSLRLGSWQSCESSVKIHPRPKIQKLYWRAATIVDMALIKCWRAGTDFGVTTGPRQKKLPRALDILSRLAMPRPKVWGINFRGYFAYFLKLIRIGTEQKQWGCFARNLVWVCFLG